MVPFGTSTRAFLKNSMPGGTIGEGRLSRQITTTSIITPRMMVGGNIFSSCEEDEELEEGFVAEGGVE